MKDSYILSSIRKTNLRYLLFDILLVFITILILVGTRQHFYNVLFGPFSLEGRNLKDPSLIYLNDKNKEYFFKISGGELIPIGSLTYSINNSFSHTANYDVLKTEDGFLPVISNQPLKTPYPQGILLSLPSAVREQLIILLNSKGIGGTVPPVMLDTTGAMMQDVWIKILFASGFCIFTLFNVIKMALRLNFRKHPLYKSLLVHGMPEAVAQSVDTELKARPLIRENHRYLVTPLWIIKKGLFTYKLAKNYLEIRRI